MSNYRYLIKVDGGENNNKFYEMVETDDGNFTANYGRVGNNPQVKIYPMSKWDSTLKTKTSTRKGYVDITESISKTKAKAKYKDISDSTIAGIIGFLMSASNKNVDDNYMVKAESVTQVQVDEAQDIINKLSLQITGKKLVKDINTNLTALYTIIPRKMKKVSDHLLSGKKIGKDSDVSVAEELLLVEQTNLDTMSSMVSMNATTNDMDDEDKENSTILDILGVSIFKVTSAEEKDIKKRLGHISDKYNSAIRIVHGKSRRLLDAEVASCDNKKTELVFHGSRNENWISILQNSLMIRPSNAIHQGAMFGPGIYGANIAKKAFGYTSSRSSYWTRGNSNKAFMALFEFHIGHQYHIKHHTSECYKFNYDYLKNKGGYDSVFAHGGADLRNDELMVYKSEKATIKYLIELKG